MPKKPAWKVLAEHTYDSFHIFSLIRSTRENPRTLEKVDYIRVQGLDWANVIALTEDKQIVLIRQYRHGADEYTLELPGGCIEREELDDPSVGAMRELAEETGFALSPKGTLKHLGSLSPNPALMSNRVHFYLARPVHLASKQNLDPNEEIEVILKPWDEFLADIKSGTIIHALNVAALSLMLLKEKI